MLARLLPCFAEKELLRGLSGDLWESILFFCRILMILPKTYYVMFKKTASAISSDELSGNKDFATQTLHKRIHTIRDRSKNREKVGRITKAPTAFPSSGKPR